MRLFFDSSCLFITLFFSFFAVETARVKTRLGRYMFMLFVFSDILAVLYILMVWSGNTAFAGYIYGGVFWCITAFSGMMLRFSLVYTGKKIPKPLPAFIHIYVIFEAVMLLTNDIHGAVANYDVVNRYGNYYIYFTPQWFFYVHLMFDTIITAAALYVIWTKRSKTESGYVKYAAGAGGVVLGVLFAFFIGSGILSTRLDFTLCLYGVVICGFYYYTFKYKPWVLMNELHKGILESLNIPYVLFDYNGTVFASNKRFDELFEFGNPDKLIIDDFFEKININVQDKTKNFEEVIEIPEKDAYYQLSYSYLTEKSRKISGYLITFQDVTSLKKAYGELERRAVYDKLTGLYNLYKLSEYLGSEEFLSSGAVAVGTCNINNLKFINDIFGSGVGDRVVKALADIVKEKTGGLYFAARQYDNIVIIMPDISEKEAILFLSGIKREFGSLTAFDFDVSMEFGIAMKCASDDGIERALSFARASMSNKKMMNENSAKSALTESLKQTLLESDYETEAHMNRTSELAVILGAKMNLSDYDLGQLRILAFFHDIGKIAIPQNILLKPDKLNDEEWDIMKTHSEKGYRIVKSFPEFDSVADGVLHHHERWDGRGYPNMLKGDEIPVLSRIIAVVDAYDVMTHDRPYHKAIPRDAAIAELIKCSGTQFDPVVTKCFVELVLMMN